MKEQKKYLTETKYTSKEVNMMSSSNSCNETVCRTVSKIATPIRCCFK